MTDTPLVSVLTPHWARPKHLALFLKAMAAQEYPHFEILLHDDGSPPAALAGAREAVLKWRARAHVRKFMIHERAYPPEAPEGHPGLARWATQYNRLFPYSKGEIVGILSSDWMPKPDFLSVVVRNLQRLGPENMVFGDVEGQKKSKVPLDEYNCGHVGAADGGDTRNQNFLWREDWQPWDESFDADGFGHSMPFWLATVMQEGVKFWVCTDMRADENEHDNPPEFIDQIKANLGHYLAKMAELKGS